MKQLVRSVIGAVAAACLIGLSANAGVVLDNTATHNDADTLSYGHWVAEAFTTDSAGDYTLNFVYAQVGTASGTIDLVAQLRKASGATVDNSGQGLIGTFTGTIPSGANAVTTFTPASTYTLSASTTYYLVLGENTSSGGGTYQWDYRTTTDVDNGTWTIPGTGTYGISLNQGGSWTMHDGSPYLIKIDATVVPEPHQYAFVAGLGLLGFVAYRNRNRLAKLA